MIKASTFSNFSFVLILMLRFFLHVILINPSIYFSVAAKVFDNVRNLKFSWTLLTDFSVITKTKLNYIIELLKSQFLQQQFRKELIFISWMFLNMLLWNSEPPWIPNACQNSISRDFWNCKLVYISRRNNQLIN